MPLANLTLFPEDTMSAVNLQGSTYTVTGTVIDSATRQPVVDVIVTAYDKDLLTKDDYLGIAPTDALGRFEIRFDAGAVGDRLLGRGPDLYSLCSTAVPCWRIPGTSPSTMQAQAPPTS